MALEASHINREMSNPGNASRFYDEGEKILPVYRFDSFPAHDFMTETGLASRVRVSRKRLRDSSSVNPPFCLPKAPIVNPNQQQFGVFGFLSEDILLQINQQQLEIDRLVAHHTEKVRTEIEDIRRRNSRRLAGAYEGIMKMLKKKEEEIVKIGHLNKLLEEKAKSLCVENQFWRELAETNEATANALRNNLEQVLAQIQLQQQQHEQQRLYFSDNGVQATIDEAQSYCGSNFDEDQVAEDDGGERKVIDESEYCKATGGRLKRRCRNCGKEESCVVLLPCRHLCVCSLCASSIGICPVCNSTKSAGVHVNMS